MQCQYEQMDCQKNGTGRCQNTATEQVLTPYGEFWMCHECAEEMKQYLQYMVHSVPKLDTKASALAHVLGCAILYDYKYGIERYGKEQCQN